MFVWIYLYSILYSIASIMLNSFGFIVIGALNVNGLRYCHGFQETKKSCLLSLKKPKKTLKHFSKKEFLLLKNKMWKTLQENLNVENRPL